MQMSYIYTAIKWFTQ